MKRNLIWMLVLVGAGLVASPVQADTITFEGIAEGTSITSINTPTNTVTFFTGGLSDPGDIGAWAHKYGTGGAGRTAYAPADNVPVCVTVDPCGPSALGQTFLSDETTLNETLESRLPYGFSFSNAVTSLSLDLLDFRGDGGSADTIIVTFWKNSDFSGASEEFQIDIDPNWGDPSGYRFSASGLGIGTFSSFAVDVTEQEGFAEDVGTGIDNLTYETIPEPGTLGLIGAGLLGLVARARRRRQS